MIRLFVAAVLALCSIAPSQVYRAWVPFDASSSPVELGDVARLLNPVPVAITVEEIDSESGFALVQIAFGAPALAAKPTIMPRPFPANVCVLDCFPEGALVATPSGSVDVSALESGSMVLDASGSPRVVRHVRRALSPAIVELCVGDQVVATTRGHEFLTPDRGLVAAADLVVGDALLCAEGAVRLTDVRRPSWAGALVPVFAIELVDGASLQVGALKLFAAADTSSEAESGVGDAAEAPSRRR